MEEGRLDDALDAVRNVHRRRLLVELREDNPHGELPEASAPTVDEDGLAVSMVHVHLPKLAEGGYVEWDRETGVVTRGPQFGELEPLLDAVSELDGHLD